MSRIEKLEKNLRPIICVLIMALDIIAGVLAIHAEKAQNKVKHSRVWIFECRTPSHKSFNLGLAASIFVILAHATANLVGGCTYIKSREELEQATANKKIAVGSLVFAWIALAVAFSFLTIGTLANSRHKQSSCTIPHNHVLAIGGALCFIHGLFAVCYYVSASAAARDDKKRHHHHPQVPSA